MEPMAWALAAQMLIAASVTSQGGGSICHVHGWTLGVATGPSPSVTSQALKLTWKLFINEKEQ